MSLQSCYSFILFFDFWIKVLYVFVTCDLKGQGVLNHTGTLFTGTANMVGVLYCKGGKDEAATND